MPLPRRLLPRPRLPEPDEPGGRVPERAYRRFRRSVVMVTLTVTLIPLVVTTIMNFLQYRQALQAEAVQPMARLTLNTKRSLELFLVRAPVGADLPRATTGHSTSCAGTPR